MVMRRFPSGKVGVKELWPECWCQQGSLGDGVNPESGVSLKITAAHLHLLGGWSVWGAAGSPGGRQCQAGGDQGCSQGRGCVIPQIEKSVVPLEI